MCLNIQKIMLIIPNYSTMKLKKKKKENIQLII